MNPEMREQFTTDAAKSIRTARNFEEYAEVFGYKGKEQELQGKTILDVGAGQSSFALEAEQYGATVVSFDASYPYTDPFYRRNAVAGLAQELPFRDGSFDEVVASFSLFHIRTGIDTALQEMLRVTKDDGYVKVHPAFVHEGILHPSITTYELSHVPYKTLVAQKTSDLSAADISIEKISYRPTGKKSRG